MSVSGNRSVERLLPFAIKARLLVVGRERLQHDRKKMQFVLISTDLSENSQKEIIKGVNPTPVVQHYSSQEFEQLLQLKGTKIVGFRQSALSRSIFEGLREFLIQSAPVSVEPSALPEITDEQSLTPELSA